MPPKPTPVQVGWWPREAGETSAPWVLALVRALRIPAPLAYGYTSFLASYTAQHWPTGRIPAGTPAEALADAAGLPVEADPAAFVAALDACGWWGIEADGSRVVHQVAQAFAGVSAARAELAEKRAAAGRLGGLTSQANAKQNQANAKQTEAKGKQTPSNDQAKSTIEGEVEGEREDPHTLGAPAAAKPTAQVDPQTARLRALAPGDADLAPLVPLAAELSTTTGRPLLAQGLRGEVRVALAAKDPDAFDALCKMADEPRLIAAAVATALAEGKHGAWAKYAAGVLASNHRNPAGLMGILAPKPGRPAPPPATETPRPNKWAARMGGADAAAAV